MRILNCSERARSVAQIFNLPFRRIAFCGAPALSSARESWAALPISNRRYGRLKIWAARVPASFLIRSRAQSMARMRARFSLPSPICTALFSGHVTKRHPEQSPVRVGLISLGCAKNLVDAEVMLGSLVRDGYEITNDPAHADVVIVNTCSFIDAAKEESVDTILESAEFREAKNRTQGLVVSGCLSQRYRDELPKLLPEVDAFMGIDQVADVSEIVKQALARRAARLENAETESRSRTSVPRPRHGLANVNQRPTIANSNELRHSEESVRQTGSQAVAVAGLGFSDAKEPPDPHPLVAIHPRPIYIPDYATPRFRLTAGHFAYLKIAEGCNHPCSFCTIPRMRGSHRSRPQDDIVEEARRLIAGGVKELNLISQDSTFYGLDLRPNRNGSIASPENFTRIVRELPANAPSLCTLLRALNGLPGEFWIRLLYTHPAHWTDELIETIAECPKVAATSICRCNTSTTRCWNGCAARPRGSASISSPGSARASQALPFERRLSWVSR